jgi:hypothetical protein
MVAIDVLEKAGYAVDYEHSDSTIIRTKLVTGQSPSNQQIVIGVQSRRDSLVLSLSMDGGPQTDGSGNKNLLARLAHQIKYEADPPPADISPVLKAGVDPLCLSAQMSGGVRGAADILHISYDSAAVEVLSTFRNSRYSSGLIRQLMCGRISIGMSDAMVWAAKGPPPEKRSTETARGTTEIWSYLDGTMLGFVNGKLVSITRDDH